MVFLYRIGYNIKYMCKEVISMKKIFSLLFSALMCLSIIAIPLKDIHYIPDSSDNTSTEISAVLRTDKLPDGGTDI